jgi:hypothetical protein
MAIAPNNVDLRSQASAWLGYSYYLSGDFESARAACESAGEDMIDDKATCLAMTYEKLGRHADAKATFDRLQASSCAAGHPVSCAAVSAQWGDTAHALDTLEKAMHSHDLYLIFVRGPLFDPLRKEPRFQAIERALKFPE